MRPDRMDNNRQTKKRHNIPKHPPPSRQNAGPIPTRRHHKPLLRITNSRHSRPALSPRHSRPLIVIPAKTGINPNSSSFPRRRESTRRRAANVAAALPPRIRRGFYIPVILATAGIHPFAILLFARKRKRRFIAENGKPPAAAKAAGN